MPMQTYPVARSNILAVLATIPGWTVKLKLRVPQAVTPSGTTVFFKARAVYMSGHSMFVDIRDYTGADFALAILAEEKRRMFQP